MQNYFTLLSLPESFALDEAALRQAYIALQQRAHPDRMLGKSEAERAMAALAAMDANEAYEALKNPLTRAQHLLSLGGIHVNSDADTVRPDPGLLMESMDIRERLAEAETERNVALIVKELQDAAEKCRAEMEAAFGTQDYERAAQLTLRLRYLAKATEEAYGRQYQLNERV